MNTLRIFPGKIREKYKRNMENAGIKNPEKYHSSMFLGSVVFSVILSSVFFFFNFNPLIFFVLLFIALQIFFYFQIALKASSRIRKMEQIFPDVIQLMSSNLRAGMTVDRAFLLSARPEFFPLDEEILKTGKEITTGKDMSAALISMGKRIDSDKISKTVTLIICGIKAGGNIATLLEQTSSNMREKDFMEKRAASSILMYVIFIFFAVCVGAPLLYGLSSVLVEIIINLVKTLPAAPTGGVGMALPITFRDIDMSPSFVLYFALVFLVVTDFISSLVIGLVNKGEEKEGLKYFIPIAAVSVGIFFTVRIVLLKFFAGTFASLK